MTQGCAAFFKGRQPLKTKKSKIILLAFRALKIPDGIIQSFLKYSPGNIPITDRRSGNEERQGQSDSVVLGPDFSTG